MNKEQKTNIKALIIYEAIVLVIYSISMLWICGGHEWAVSKIEELKEKRKVRKERKYVTRYFGEEEEES